MKDLSIKNIIDNKWIILERIKGKHIKFKCKCMKCGNTQIIGKESLIRDDFIVECKKCNSKIGKKFGKLRVLPIYHLYKGRTHYLCKCDCGRYKEVNGSSLEFGKTKTCGKCDQTRDLTNQKFDRLTAKYRVENKGERVRWHCICDCGNELDVNSNDLVNGNSKSCGCLRIDKIKEKNTIHGLSGTRLYHIYYSMYDRCYNENNKNYNDYGKRGILICDEWLNKENGFVNFYNWSINNGYNDKLSIDRINNNESYSPNNCRWANILIQANNKRSNTIIEIDNEKYSLAEVARKFNLNYESTRNKFNKGINIDYMIHDTTNINIKGDINIMYKIIVKHSSIHIENYTMGDCPRLEKYFTVEDVFTHKSYYIALEYISERKELIIPRGIDIYFVEQLLGTKAMVDYKPDEYDYIEDSLKIKYLPRDDKQKEALRFMLSKGEYKNNEKYTQMSINLNTGAGKTYVSIATLAYLSIRGIIITSSINWLNQWKKCIVEYTNIKPKEIYFISGSQSIHNLLRRDIKKYKVILASHNTIKSYGDKHGWDKVTELFKYMRVGLKFYDEAHLNFDNLCKIDYYTNTAMSYLLTATPARSNEQEDFVYKLYIKNVPKIDLFDENEDPHTHYISIKYRSHPTAQQISECKNMYGLNRNGYTNYIIQKENYYNILIVILNMALSMNGKALIYIGTNKAILETRAWIIETFPELRNEVGVYTSIIKDEKVKKKQLEKKIILSTTKSCGAAMDIKGLKITIVLAEPFKSEVVARQTLGRTRDDDTYYIEIVDTSFYAINKYYYSKKNIFAKYALSCQEISLDDRELEFKAGNILRAREESIKLLRKINPLIFNGSKTIKPFIFHEDKKIKPLKFRSIAYH